MSTIENHVEEELSGFIDGELTQQQSQRIALHLEQCSKCQAAYTDLEALKLRIRRADLGGKGEQYWRENMRDTAAQTSYGIGWVLLLGGVLVIGAFGIYDFFTHSPMSWLKAAVGAAYLGLALLFVSVLRQRLIARKTDKYKDVEI